MNDSTMLSFLIIFIAGLAVLEHQPILAFVLAVLAIGVLHD